MSERTLPSAFDLTGHVALVTGSSSDIGIGFACARLLGAGRPRIAGAWRARSKHLMTRAAGRRRGRQQRYQDDKAAQPAAQHGQTQS